MKQHNTPTLEVLLDQASPVPDMPAARIHAAAMDAFASRRPVMDTMVARFGALAATIVLGVGGFMALQSYQAHQKAVMADADAFAEALLSESF
jgi:CHASE2 domain-containing sensor protein